MIKNTEERTGEQEGLRKNRKCVIEKEQGQDLIFENGKKRGELLENKKKKKRDKRKKGL